MRRAAGVGVAHVATGPCCYWRHLRHIHVLPDTEQCLHVLPAPHAGVPHQFARASDFFIPDFFEAPLESLSAKLSLKNG